MVGARVVCRGRGGAPDHNRRRHSRGGSAARLPRRQQRLVALVANQSGACRRGMARWDLRLGVWSCRRDQHPDLRDAASLSARPDGRCCRDHIAGRRLDLDRRAGAPLSRRNRARCRGRDRRHALARRHPARHAGSASRWAGDRTIRHPGGRRGAPRHSLPRWKHPQFSDDGGELLHCTLAERSVIAVRSSRPAVAAARSR